MINVVESARALMSLFEFRSWLHLRLLSCLLIIIIIIIIIAIFNISNLVEPCLHYPIVKSNSCFFYLLSFCSHFLKIFLPLLFVQVNLSIKALMGRFSSVKPSLLHHDFFEPTGTHHSLPPTLILHFSFPGHLGASCFHNSSVITIRVESCLHFFCITLNSSVL